MDSRGHPAAIAPAALAPGRTVLMKERRYQGKFTTQVVNVAD
jgi:hypothetical protein